MSNQPKSTSPKNRCAIYTRKSCEEGLELEFNSLHAQRESAEAFIASQQHEGWECLPGASTASFTKRTPTNPDCSPWGPSAGRCLSIQRAKETGRMASRRVCRQSADAKTTSPPGLDGVPRRR